MDLLLLEVVVGLLCLVVVWGGLHRVGFLFGALEVRPIWFVVLGLGRVRERVLHEVLLSHAEVLVFQLLYPPFQSSVLVSQLNQLLVHFIDCGDFGSDVFESAVAKFTVLIVAPLHDALDLRAHQLVVVLAVVLQNALDQLQPLPKRLVFNLQLEAVCVLVLEVPLHFLDVFPQFRVCLQQVRHSVHAVDQAFSRRVHFLLVLLEVEVGHGAGLGLPAEEGLVGGEAASQRAARGGVQFTIVIFFPLGDVGKARLVVLAKHAHFALGPRDSLIK